MNEYTDLAGESNTNLQKRHRDSKIWRTIFYASTAAAIIILAILILSIVNQAFGLVVLKNTVEPEKISSVPLEQLSSQDLIKILKKNLTSNRYKTIDRDMPFTARSQADLVDLVIAEVVKPTVVDSYHLDVSILHRNEIMARAAEKYPNGHVEFHSWLNPEFITRSMSSTPELAGVRTAIFGSLWIILITVLVAFPTGVGAAIYLEEYAASNRINKIIQTNIDNLAGVPSIIYGILGLAIFVRGLGYFTGGGFLGSGETGGRTILSAGLTMALLILPILIINAQEAIRAVPRSLREASYGLGATKWQTIWHHVLPSALPGILTGTILAISRAIGETAPLILVGASSFINRDPSSVFSRFTALPIQIYNWTTRPQDEFRNIAAAAILVLLVLLLSLNAFAILMRNRFTRRIS
ncbi:phosphate ABC transporter permease PstA [Leptolinea tardivitalis]|uniref:Phosphate transport system permease protein PstA n=1 Tax=Leptolinea tardivitalis TaxID=229920 RepID=A0A0P6XCV2_9CHLR|nr:phosphate ABC transporter permease PstA [Leptolinea tardivitalis]KPL72732.1 phosphate ABC transporter permease [Leptolinea tardivitalis]GAP20922.1 phosphate ABC transporter membrane protein 2, PhoT family [Leptolinea tardivitalis]